MKTPERRYRANSAEVCLGVFCNCEPAEIAPAKSFVQKELVYTRSKMGYNS